MLWSRAVERIAVSEAARRECAGVSGQRRGSSGRRSELARGARVCSELSVVSAGCRGWGVGWGRGGVCEICVLRAY